MNASTASVNLVVMYPEVDPWVLLWRDTDSDPLLDDSQEEDIEKPEDGSFSEDQTDDALVHSSDCGCL